MAKVNLLTMHYTDNNGSFFQTYATCRLLEECGHSVTIINLQDRNWNRGRWKRWISYYKLLRYLRFELARKKYYPPRTKLMFKVDTQLIPEADYYIVGSDQVWNKDITYYDYLSYFLAFVNKGKRISLSSSMGIKWNVDEGLTKSVKEELNKFNAVSVRELDMVDACKRLFGIDPVCLIDPTLAWGNYSEFLHKGNERNHVGIYTYRSSGYAPLIAHSLGESMKQNVHWTNELPKKGFKSGLLFWEDPTDWINTINTSSIFVTDSFHGVAFSLILNVPFIATVASKNKISRIESLLSIAGLESRLVHSMDDYVARRESLLEPIDWPSVNQRIEIEREKYKQFVKSYIV